VLESDIFKPSRYNLIDEDESGYYLLANTFSRALIRVNTATFKKVKEILDEPTIDINSMNRNKILAQSLVENRFLIPGDFDELEFLGNLYEKSRKWEKDLGVAIVLTLNCNFDCVYCYQDHLALDMPKKVEDSILKYVKRNLPGLEKLAISWFGGEPTLRMERIKNLSAILMNSCENNGCTYQSAITTNGFLLTGANAEILKTCCIENVQVTLDGPAAIHDQRRFLKSGKGTFDTILDNVMTSAHLFEKFTLRINIDRFNANSIIQLLEILEPIKNEVRLAFRPTQSYEFSKNSVHPTFSQSEYLPIEDRLIDEASQRGFRILIGYTGLSSTFCSAYRQNVFTVDPYGDVHRCPNVIGRRKDRYGFLNREGVLIRNDNSIQREWDTYTPLDTTECRVCIALPLCMGGCLWNSQSSKVNSYKCFPKYGIIKRMRVDCSLNTNLSTGGDNYE